MDGHVLQSQCLCCCFFPLIFTFSASSECECNVDVCFIISGVGIECWRLVSVIGEMAHIGHFSTLCGGFLDLYVSSARIYCCLLIWGTSSIRNCKRSGH